MNALENPRHPIYLFILCSLLSGCIVLGYKLYNKKPITNPPATSGLELEMVNGIASVNLHAIGQQLVFPEELECINPKRLTQGRSPTNGRRIILVLNELGCNVCADHESQFLKELAENNEEAQVYAVVHARTKRYAKNYVRMNQANYPVFFDKDQTFEGVNHLPTTPLILFINEEGIILASHYPRAENLDLCKPYHQRARTFWN